MDDERNGQFARAPEIEDLIRICRKLNELDAKYVLIGGFAVILNGYVRGTRDIDFLVESSEDNVLKLKSALSILADNAAAAMMPDEIKKHFVVRVADEIVIDLMGQVCGVEYDEASKEIEYYEIEGVEIPVASRALLIRLKDTVRPSDMSDVMFLKASLEADKSKT